MKGEVVYRELLKGVYEDKIVQFTVRGLSKSTGVPASTVSHSLKPLKEMGAVEVHDRGLLVKNPRKVLLFWASVRRLPSLLVFRKSLKMEVEEIEGMVPPGSIFTAFTAFKHRFNSAPADYSEVYVYGDENDFHARFGPSSSQRERCNLIVLKTDPHLKKLGIATLAQIYVDLWNIPAWYAQAFIDELDKVM